MQSAAAATLLLNLPLKKQAALKLFMLLLCLFLMWMGGTTKAAWAAFSRVEEAPDVMLYRARQSLRDSSGNSWQVILFKYVKAGVAQPIVLRLVGFPGIATIPHPKVLMLQAGDQQWAVPDLQSDRPALSHLGEYDLTVVLPQLESIGTVWLRLPTAAGQTTLRIPDFVVQEWQQVANEPL